MRKNFKKVIDVRMQFIEKFYPETKSFLLKLDNAFLFDFIANKINNVIYYFVSYYEKKFLIKNDIFDFISVF